MKSSIILLAIARAEALASDASCADASCAADATSLLQSALRTSSLQASAAGVERQPTADNSYLTVVSWPAHAWREWDSTAKGSIGKCMSQDATTDEDGSGFLFASCCTSDGAGMSRNCGDAGPKTFAQAEAICIAQGGQLCTAEEAAVDLATASKGCQVDGPRRASGADMNRLWTETRCEQCYGTHEAEDATIIGGAVEHANVNSPGHAGFTGRSFVDYINPDGDYIEWYMSSCDEGPATASFRYALASNNRPLQVLVNGQEVDSGLLDFGRTASWSTWADVSVSVSLNAGSNVIRLVASGRSGANMDSLTLARVVPVATTTQCSFSGPLVVDGSWSYANEPITVECSAQQHWNAFHLKPTTVDWYYQVVTPNPEDFIRFSMQIGLEPTYRIDYSDDGSSWAIAAQAGTHKNVEWSSVGAHRYWRCMITSGSANMNWYRQLEFHTE